MTGFENLRVFKADHVDIGEFLHGFYKQEICPPEKDILFLPLNFPSGLAPKPPGSRKHDVTALPTLSFSPVLG